jgi:hypothetical protein
MWPRAKLAASRAHAKMLGVYMAQGPTWDSKPRELAWSSLLGRPPVRSVLPPDAAVAFDGYY